MHVPTRTNAPIRGAGFTGEGFSAEDTLPLSVFDAREVAKLSPYIAGSDEATERKRMDSFSHGLWEAAEHPFSKVLRENDLDMAGDFFVGRSFAVTLTTQMRPDQYKDSLMTAVPLMRFQPIHVRTRASIMS